jgi:acetoin utilization deacetylase AcuC-like enzyme
MITVYSPIHKLHVPPFILRGGFTFPSLEVPDRAGRMISAIESFGANSIVAPDDVDLECIYDVHCRGMVKYLSTVYNDENTGRAKPSPIFPSDFALPRQRNCPSSLAGQRGFFCTDTGTPICTNTWDAVSAAARCALTGVRYLLEGTPCVYALCRPPGHHAGPDFFGGYCYLNNAAIAAMRLGKEGRRIAILDIDYHHGSGTQAIFYTHPTVFYGSIHIDPNIGYPYFSGYESEIGDASGKGTNRNIPLPPGTTTVGYLSALDTLLDWYHELKAEYIIVSLGFDIYMYDPIGTFCIDTSGINTIARHIRSLGIPVLVVQEGGYHLPSIGRNLVAFLEGLTGSAREPQ